MSKISVHLFHHSKGRGGPDDYKVKFINKHATDVISTIRSSAGYEKGMIVTEVENLEDLLTVEASRGSGTIFAVRNFMDLVRILNDSLLAEEHGAFGRWMERDRQLLHVLHTLRERGRAEEYMLLYNYGMYDEIYEKDGLPRPVPDHYVRPSAIFGVCYGNIHVHEPEVVKHDVSSLW
jgi:hypothetical protein